MSLAGEYLRQTAAHLRETGRVFTPKPSASETLATLQEWTHKFVAARLAAPLVGGGDLRLQADRCAERYVFEEEAPKTTRNLIKIGAVDQELVWASTKLPATNVWIEYPLDKDSSVGGLLQRVGLMVGSVAMADNPVLTNYRTVMAMVGQTPDWTRVLGLMTLPATPWAVGKTFVELHWFLDYSAHDKYESKEERESHNADCKNFIFDLVDCLFLINTPRVCELREGSCGPRKPKIQARTGVPLIEYKRVIIKVGVGAPHYVRNGAPQPLQGESDEDRQRRLHRVVGHFRTYRKDREQPKVAFVPQHWRGNAELGVLLHERVVKR